MFSYFLDSNPLLMSKFMSDIILSLISIYDLDSLETIIILFKRVTNFTEGSLYSQECGSCPLE